MPYKSSEAYHLAQMRDVPPIAGAIIWAREPTTHVHEARGRRPREMYAEGRKLEAESAAFVRKLDT